AAGVNFRDVLIALGMYPGDAPLGSEAAGVVLDRAVSAATSPPHRDIRQAPAMTRCHWSRPGPRRILGGSIRRPSPETPMDTAPPRIARTAPAAVPPHGPPGAATPRRTAGRRR
ncbi:hypothetical protein AB0957_36160, partial [Streptomyces zhihengii]|uniref:hypothetical protein n=1 Tax=Streptomyces zhihengii TaxID=1818004 RepID=UPI003454F0DC